MEQGDTDFHNPQDWRILEYGKSEAKLARMTEEATAWKRKYEEVFQEQCKVVSGETKLQARVRELEAEGRKHTAMIEAQREIIHWLIRLEIGQEAPQLR